MWDELYGSEGKAQVTFLRYFLFLNNELKYKTKIQVHACIVEYLASLTEEDRQALTTCLYDDMCHLARYAWNQVTSYFTYSAPSSCS